MTASFIDRPRAARPRPARAGRLGVTLFLALVASVAISGEAFAGSIVSFGTPTSFPLGTTPNELVTGDFNADGDPDVAIATNSGISILTGSTGGTFSGPTNIPVSGGAVAIAVGNFNSDQDSDPDLVVVGNGGVSIFLGGALSTFTPGQVMADGNFPNALAVGDFNGDGDPEIAVANQNTDNVWIFTAGTGGSFVSTPTVAAAGDRPGAIAIGDFNGDGDRDLAVANLGPVSDPAPDNISILTGSTGVTFAGPTNLTVGDSPQGVATADFNQDGDLDLAVSNQTVGTGTSQTVSILTGTGAGAGFALSSTLAGGARAVATGDFNKDGDPDLAVGGNTTNNLSIFVGGAGAAFGSAQTFAMGGDVLSLAVADFNADTLPDVAGANTFANTASTVLNTSDLTAPDTTIAAGPSEATNDNTPTFTFSSGEAGVSFQCRVDTAAFTACTSPHTTGALSDGAHTFEVRAVDAGGNIDATPASRSFTVDTAVPDTTITAGPSGATNDNTPTFSFSSNEAGASFQCRVDTAAFTACTSPHTTAALADGAHTFEVRAVDAAGNVDATPAARSLTVDAAPPETVLASGPSGLTNDPTPTFTFTASKPGSTFECRVDTAAFTACTSAFTTGALTDGAHTFEVRAVDAGGNVDATPASRSFTVDTAVPDTTITAGPSGATNDNTPTFTFTSSEAGASFQCRVDTAAFTACTSPHTTAALADGAHTFEVRAVDAAGNVDATPASRAVDVDAAPPDTVLASGPSGPTNDSTPTFTFTASKPGSTFECRVGAAAFASCTSPHTTAALSDGPKTFEVRAIDALGNADPASATRTFTVDTTPPETIISAGPTGTTSDSSPTFEFSSTEPGAKFQCRLDEGAWVPCSSPHTLPGLPAGSHTFRVRSIDAAGNVDASPASTLDPNAALRSFTIGAGVPGAPILGRRVNAEPVNGDVFVSVPPGTVARASASVPGLKGRNFIPLREARQLPVGSIFDTRKGTVRLTSARNTRGVTQSGEFLGGVFQVLQSRKASAKGLTELRLKGASFRGCGRATGKKANAAASRRRIRRLRGSGRGRFRTRGRYSAATVRGTIWTVTDRCDGTLTKVTRGKVAVRDLRRRKTILLRAGKSYFARARR